MIDDSPSTALWSLGGMTGRAGERLRQEVRRQQLTFLRRNGWPIVGFVLFELVVLVPLGFLVPGPLRGFALGVVVASVFWLVVLLVRDYSGSHRAQLGADGEESTAFVLRSLERAGWSVVHDIEFDGFNVDHVVVGRGGVFAIETKNTAGHWNLRLSGGGLYLARAAEQARFGARKIRLLLREVGDFRVAPIVIGWGPGVQDYEDTNTVVCGDVRVVVGRHARAVLPQLLVEDELDPVTVDLVVQRLEAYVRIRSDHRKASIARSTPERRDGQRNRRSRRTRQGT